MSTPMDPPRRSRTPVGLRSFWAGISAVGTKELRGRMRGRRAFVVVTIYLLLLSLFAFGLYQLLQEAAASQARFVAEPGFGRDGFSGSFVSGPVSAEIGHALFSGIVVIQTLLILVLAPAFTSGAISMEREKQTLELLITTPLSTLGMVVGKLLSALAYLFLLVVASIPLMALVFAFGGVGPDDLVRAYVLLFATAFGMGAIGLFMSALVGRTQVATVLSYVIVLGLTIGTFAVHTYLMATSPRTDDGGFVAIEQRHQAPEALLWLNPLVADLDLMCVTAPSGYHATCSYIAMVTGRPYFGDWSTQMRAVDRPARGVIVGDGPEEAAEVLGAVGIEEQLETGFPRDTFWPRTGAAFLILGLALTLLSTQLIAPSRRLRRRRRPPSRDHPEPIPDPTTHAEVQP